MQYKQKNIKDAQKLIGVCKEQQEVSLHLDLGEYAIYDLLELPELFECTHLKYLTICDDHIENIYKTEWKNKHCSSKIPTQMENLVNLKELTIDAPKYCSHIKDYSVLSKLKNLKYLSLSGSPCPNIAFIKELSNLCFLQLEAMGIVDISPVENLGNLEILKLDCNEIVDVSPVKGLNNLETLSLAYSKISDISPISKLSKLSCLDLFKTKTLSDISSIGNLRALVDINIGCTSVVDLSILEKMPQLKFLKMRGLHVSDISFLKRFHELIALNIRETPITNIDVLNDLPKLKKINIGVQKGTPKTIQRTLS